MQIKGIDVARYQGLIDWDRVKASGIKFAMLRAVSTRQSEGGIYIDPTFERNYAECKRVGMPCGVYYYTYAQDIKTVQAELNMLYKAIDGKKFEYPIAIDVEENRLKPLSRDALTTLVCFAAESLESKGYFVQIYTYTYYKQTELDMLRLGKYDLWIADYRGKRPVFNHGMWQFSSTGSVPGIKKLVDMNWAYRDYPGMIKKAGLNGYSKKPAPELCDPKKMYKLCLGWLSRGDFCEAEQALLPVIKKNDLGGLYTVEEAAHVN